jgi:hypothetical protein
MTNREFYTNILNATEITNEMREFAEQAIAKLDVTNEKRKSAAAVKAAEKQAEKAPIRNALFEAIGSEPKTATELVALIAAEFEVKTASVPSLLKPFVEDGSVLKVDVKVKGKGTQRGYVKA